MRDLIYGHSDAVTYDHIESVTYGKESHPQIPLNSG